MAQAYTVVGSTFRPFSLQEYLAPLQEYQKEYQRQEDLYNTYTDNAGIIGSYLDSEADREVLDNIYNPYMKELEAAASALSSEGLSQDTRKNLQALRRRYTKEIAPISLAAEARKEAQKKYDERIKSDSTLMSSFNPYLASVSQYMNGNNPQASYVSGNELYSRGQAISKAMSNVLREVPEEAKLALQDQYWKIVQERGFNSGEMQDFMAGIENAVPELEGQIEEILSSTGMYENGFTESDINKARQYITEGMISGMSGDTKVDYTANKQWDWDRKLAYERAKRKEDESTEKTEAPYVADPFIVGNRSNVGRRDKRALNEQVKEVEDFVPVTTSNGTEYIPSELLSLFNDLEQKRQKVKENPYTGSIRGKGGVSNPEIDAQNRQNLQYKQEFEEADKAFRKAKSKWDIRKKEIEDKYSYLGNDFYYYANVGSKLDQIQSSEQYAVYNMFYKDSQNRDVMANFSDMISSGAATRDTIYEIDSNGKIGKPASKKDVENIMEEGKNIPLTYDSDGHAVITYGGKRYYVSGTEGMQAAEENFNFVKGSLNHFGRDSKEITLNPITKEKITVPGVQKPDNRQDNYEFFMTMYSGGTVDLNTIEDYNGQFIKDSSGNNVGAIIDINDKKGNLHRILFDTSGNMLGSLGIEDVLSGNNKTTEFMDRYMGNLITNLPKTYARSN